MNNNDKENIAQIDKQGRKTAKEKMIITRSPSKSCSDTVLNELPITSAKKKSWFGTSIERDWEVLAINNRWINNLLE